MEGQYRVNDKRACYGLKVDRLARAVDTVFRAMGCFGYISGFQFAKGLELFFYCCHDKLSQI